MSKKRDELDEFEAHLKRTQIAISEEMLRQGTVAYRRALVGTISFLSAGGLIAAITVLFDLQWVFYVFAGVLLIAAIRAWLNARDMERFIEAVQQDLLEIQK